MYTFHTEMQLCPTNAETGIFRLIVVLLDGYIKRGKSVTEGGRIFQCTVGQCLIVQYLISVTLRGSPVLVCSGPNIGMLKHLAENRFDKHVSFSAV